jgi:EAL domain-containing protein (putative c-di-GMP-specific phosphodiesterase class I)
MGHTLAEAPGSRHAKGGADRGHSHRRPLIDDFGTGFSALEFKRFTIQGLKMDR